MEKVAVVYAVGGGALRDSDGRWSIQGTESQERALRALSIATQLWIQGYQVFLVLSGGPAHGQPPDFAEAVLMQQEVKVGAATWEGITTLVEKETMGSSTQPYAVLQTVIETAHIPVTAISRIDGVTSGWPHALELHNWTRGALMRLTGNRRIKIPIKIHHLGRLPVFPQGWGWELGKLTLSIIDPQNQSKLAQGVVARLIQGRKKGKYQRPPHPAPVSR